MRLAAAAIGLALFLLGLGIATSTGTAVAKKQSGKAGKKGGKSTTKTYVARSRTDNNASAIVKAKLSPAGVPVRVTMVRVINLDGACTATSPALISESIETTYKYPVSLKVTAKKVKGRTVWGFNGKSSAGGKATTVSGEFLARGMNVGFTQMYPKTVEILGGFPITLACETTADMTTAGKSSRGEGQGPGGKTKDKGAGKTRDRGPRTR
jgi:hypothetical protein